MRITKSDFPPPYRNRMGTLILAEILAEAADHEYCLPWSVTLSQCSARRLQRAVNRLRFVWCGVHPTERFTSPYFYGG